MLAPTLRRDLILTSCGLLTFRPLDPGADAATAHAWITHPRSAFWGAQGASVQDIHREYQRIADAPGESAWIVERSEEPIALVETYCPGDSPLAAYVEQGAIPAEAAGMHVLIAPPTGEPEAGLTSCVFAAVMRWLVDVHRAPAVVVEPDSRNEAIIAKNLAAGFADVPDLQAVRLPFGEGEKTARVQLCPAGAFRASSLAPHASARVAPDVGCPGQAVGPLDPGAQHVLSYGDRIHRELLAKALREFIHERLLAPEDLGPCAPAAEGGDAAGDRTGDTTGEGTGAGTGAGAAASPAPNSPAALVTAGSPACTPAPLHRYRVDFAGRRLLFDARPYPLEHLAIEPGSIHADDGQPLSLAELVASAADQLGASGEHLHTYLAEVQATLATRTRATHRPRPSAEQLACPSSSTGLTPFRQATYLQLVEGSMVEGHPGFVANAGRGGMSEAELEAYAPELGESLQLVWLAARREACVAATSTDLPEFPDCVDELLGPVSAAWFRCQLRALGRDPQGYVPLPVHPWQWNNRLVTAFAEDIARGDLVFVGYDHELYRPQQSLRTLFPVSQPELPYVKTATAVLNMGFTRGLSPTYMRDTPAINDWLRDTLGRDADFAAHGVRLLREIAAVGYVGDVYHRTGQEGPGRPAGSGESGDSGAKTAYHKMLAGLWRSSPIPLLAEGCVAASLAAVLHRDPSGRPLAAQWIHQSGHSARQWVAALLRVYLRPVIRALDGYGVAFMPHGENVVLELRDGLPVGSFFKDLGEEVVVLRRDVPLPSRCERIRVDDGSMTDEQRALCVHTDVLDGVLRHLCALLDAGGVLGAQEFWELARQCVLDYERDYPGATQRLPLLAADFPHSCLNRLQLRNPTSMVDLTDQTGSLLYAGRLVNPLHRG